MKFFIPHADGAEQENMVYTRIRSNARENTGWEIHNEKIFLLEYSHEGIDYVAEVGKINKQAGEEVVAILASSTYLICTRNRGVIRGGAIKVGRSEVTRVEKFE
jgi:hypothetical protein